ncbi:MULTISPECIES: exopolysaccharide Pel transporter PelG [Methylobacterium]|uniref:exopolysaccharide Pel transporter PelG n=1 Tax=Methylobacterium TaxID=407 RepID=UPI0013EBE714|nr:exopolysaccharide Pel transporter PelG [Methylobacterium sp. DB0501]NGM38951.1 exopolysaccharide Pel transporter PelG [Methylobacterium sp. DB0501]
MAGIGFALERMTTGKSLSSTAGAYLYAAFLVAGPWIFTVLAIAGVSSAACTVADCLGLQIFRSIMIYNTCVTAILTGPLAFVCTRYVSDHIWMKRYESIAFSFAAAFAAFAVTALLVCGPFYVWMTDLSAPELLAALQNLMLLGAAWLLIPFIGATRGYLAVSAAFAVGVAVMVSTLLLAPGEEPVRLLGAFNLGLCIIDFGLAWRLAREYGLTLVPDRELLRTAAIYWELPVIGLTFACGLWVDKLVMWAAAPIGVATVAMGLRTMPTYDTPMFWAQLAALPIFAVFFVHVETNFFRLSRAYYGSLAHQVSRRNLLRMQSRMAGFVVSKVFTLFLSLAVIALIAILISFVAIEPLGLRASQMGILRAALVGMVFHTSAVFCFVFLLYFDLRRYALAISVTYFVLNGALTSALLPLGFSFFGYGNLIASAITLVLAIAILARELSWLDFHAFITNNTSLRTERRRVAAGSPGASDGVPS